MATTIILFCTVVLCYLSRQARSIFVLSIPLVYNIYIILIARVRVQYGKIFYEHAKYFHEPKASENVA